MKPLSKQTLKVRSSQAGFTLFELILVLFILGLSAGIVMFAGSRLQEKSIFNTEARKLFLTVQHAREMSILERRDIVFKVDVEAKKYWLTYGGDKGSEMHVIPPRFTLTGEDIFFFPKGNSSGGKIDIDNGKGLKYEVTVDQAFGTTAIKRL